MKQHSKSLLFSILIHSLLFITVIYLYKTVSTKVISAHNEKICIRLNCITHKPKEQTIKKQTEKKVIKQEKKKKIIKEKIKQKKKIEPKTEPKIEKIAEEVTQEQKPKMKQTSEVKEVQEVTTKRETQEIPKKEESSQPAVAQDMYINKNIDKISQLIKDNLYYPRSARKRGIQGEVVVKFTLLKDATISSIEITKSNHKILARAAKKTIERLSGKFPKPNTYLILTVPISYTLH